MSLNKNKESIFGRIRDLRKKDHLYPNRNVIEELKKSKKGYENFLNEQFKINTNLPKFVQEIFYFILFQENISNHIKKLIQKHLEQKVCEFEMQDNSCIDALTKIPSRYSLDSYTQVLEREESVNENFTYWVIVIDLDNFKGINDEHWHLAGDEALKTFAQLLKSLLRKSDLIFRYGGDEFVIIIPNADEEGLKKVAENLLSVWEFTFFVRGKDGKPYKINRTVSLGLSLSSEVESNRFDDVFGKADFRLQDVKESGKNAFSFERETMVDSEKIPGMIRWRRREELKGID